MMERNNAPVPVVCIAGPTGAGKTALAIGLAQRFDGEVVNCDSRQVYRDFPIITAQPLPEERTACPHHLYGYLEIQEKTDTADWSRRAMECVRDITARGKLPLLVGGTGLYFQTLLRGIADIPPIPQALHADVLARIEVQGSQAMHAHLATLDAISAARIHPNDRQRVARAIEVYEATGRTLSDWHRSAEAKPVCTGPLLVVDTPLADLEPRLSRRIDVMLEMGALSEARRALATCPDADAPGWSGIGCREVRAMIEGSMSTAEAREAWFRNTRAYAKRQITWFRGRSETIWISQEDMEGTARLCAQALGR